jgi:hypothetical protein
MLFQFSRGPWNRKRNFVNLLNPHEIAVHHGLSSDLAAQSFSVWMAIEQ